MSHIENRLKDFCHHLERTYRFSEKTLRTYAIVLRGYLNHTQILDIVRLGYVQDYMVNILKSSSTSTQRVTLSAIKAYCKYLLEHDRDVDKEILEMKLAKAWYKVPEVLIREEVEKMLVSCDTSTEAGRRDFTLIATLYSTGLRVSELCELKTKDLRNKSMFIRNGKGGKERCIPLIEYTRNLLEGLVKERKDKNCAHIFQNNYGGPLYPLTAWRYIKHYAEKAGIERRITPHVFRHAYATHMVDNGVDVRIVQELLGHANLDTTNVYVHTSLKKLQEDFERFHPRYYGGPSEVDVQNVELG